MTHFNHEWDTTKTPAVPVSVGDRYYAQDLNDDFNYLKHLPYEVFLQGRSRGVMVAPNDAWDNNTNSLSLSGGFGAILQDNIELDPNEDFVIPPKTHSSPRYERISFIDTVLVLPNDGVTHYIVATPTKRSFLQRIKTLFLDQYASRIRYDGVITIQDTAPTAEQILVGLCNDKEYCLLTDIDPNQCKDNIILKKWFGQNKITQGFVSILRSYYNTSITSVETKISIDTVNGNNQGISSGTFKNCRISINTVNGNDCVGIYGGTFENCHISINTISSVGDMTSSIGINGGTFTNCTVSIGTINCGDDASGAYGIYGGTFENCRVSIGTVGRNISYGIEGGTFEKCHISIDASSGISIGNKTILYLTHITAHRDLDLQYTGGKLNVVNDTVLHAS